jgi:hypothetical protein
MRTGIVRVRSALADAQPEAEFGQRCAALAERGYQLLPAPLRPAGPALREVAFVLEGDDADALGRLAVAVAREVLADDARVTSVTFLSRGTDDDLRGVARGLGVRVEISRTVEDGEEVIVVGVPAADLRRVPESRLHTALEAASNAEVRIVATG